MATSLLTEGAGNTIVARCQRRPIEGVSALKVNLGHTHPRDSVARALGVLLCVFATLFSGCGGGENHFSQQFVTPTPRPAATPTPDPTATATPTPTPTPTSTPTPSPGLSGSQLLVADLKQNRIVSIDLNHPGNSVSLDHNPNNPTDNLKGPTGVFAEADGHIYIADSDATSGRIVRVDDISGKGWTTTQKYNGSVYAVWVDQGRIFLLNGNKLFWLNSLSDTTFNSYGSSNPSSPEYLATPESFCIAGGMIYIADSQNARIVRLNENDLSQRENWDEPDKFEGIHGVFVTPAGAVYVTTDASATKRGVLTAPSWKGTLQGSINALTNSPITEPWGIFVDSVNRIYVTDTETARVSRMADVNFNQFEAWGEGGTPGLTGVSFDTPWSVFVH